MLYLINYTLSNPEDRYAALWNALDEMGAERLITPQFVVRKENTTVLDVSEGGVAVRLAVREVCGGGVGVSGWHVHWVR